MAVFCEDKIVRYVKYRHSRNNRLCLFYIAWDMYFTDEVEDNLCHIPFTFLVSEIAP